MQWWTATNLFVGEGSGEIKCAPFFDRHGNIACFPNLDGLSMIGEDGECSSEPNVNLLVKHAKGKELAKNGDRRGLGAAAMRVFAVFWAPFGPLRAVEPNRPQCTPAPTPEPSPFASALEGGMGKEVSATLFRPGAAGAPSQRAGVPPSEAGPPPARPKIAGDSAIPPQSEKIGSRSSSFAHRWRKKPSP